MNNKNSLIWKIISDSLNNIVEKTEKRFIDFEGWLDKLSDYLKT